MAIEPELRKSIRAIEADQPEMDRYRKQLAGNLAKRQTPFSWSFWLKAIPVTALGLAVFFVFYSPQDFSHKSIEELQQLVATTSDLPELRRKAEAYSLENGSLDALNANFVLSLTQSGENGLVAAAKGLEIDPRSEFRQVYLEQLLDSVDRYRFNSDVIEHLMEKETDKTCLRLYRHLLRYS